jgi:hypothetical protein
MTRLSEHFLDGTNTEWQLELQCDVHQDSRQTVLSLRRMPCREVSILLGTRAEQHGVGGGSALVPACDLISFFRRALAMMEADLQAYEDEEAPHYPGWAGEVFEVLQDQEAEKAKDRTAEKEGS